VGFDAVVECARGRFGERSLRPNQSIERKASGTLRVPTASAHLQR
jgi:hypothetical protein